MKELVSFFSFGENVAAATETDVDVVVTRDIDNRQDVFTSGIITLGISIVTELAPQAVLRKFFAFPIVSVPGLACLVKRRN
jgi:hypothetical protein